MRGVGNGMCFVFCGESDEQGREVEENRREQKRGEKEENNREQKRIGENKRTIR